MNGTTISPLAWLALIGPVASAAVAGAVAVRSVTNPAGTRRAGVAATCLGVLGAVGAGLAVEIAGAVESPTIGGSGLGLSVRLDPISVVMLGMISLLAVVIVRFAGTYLEGDARHTEFLGRLAATIAAVEVLVLAGNVVLLVAAWMATSLALHRLLVFYPERRRAVIAARKKFVIARIGDAFLVAACVLLVHHVGSGDLGAIFTAVQGTPADRAGDAVVAAAALCLVLAACLKSAQLPTHGWLVEVMETPTPVSALLHAGILNAGPFLVIRMAYVVNAARPATALLIIVGGLTATFASIVLLTQPSVKVALGYSSAAHMGFMLLVCGLGVYPAAMLHLVAHSFYKAHAFLSSGSAIDEARAAGVAVPRRRGSPARLVASAALATAIYAVLAVLWQVDLGGEPTLLAVGAILVLGTTQLIAPALDSDGPAVGAVRAGLLALWVTVAFFALEGGLKHVLGPSVPVIRHPEGLDLALMVAVLTAFTVVIGFQLVEPARVHQGTWRRTLAIHVRNGLYANALLDRTVGALRLPATAHQGDAR